MDTELKRDWPLRRLSSLGIGGTAWGYASVDSREDLFALIHAAQSESRPVRIIGGGTNLVFTDAGFPGLVIRLGDEFRQIRFEGETATAGAAAPLSALIARCIERGLSGVEGLSGIPGTVGGAVVQNSSNSDYDTAACLQSAAYYDLQTGKEAAKPAEELGMGYRTSLFKKIPAVILSAKFSLRPKAREELLAEVNRRMKYRAETQPSGKSVGCIFKNPPGESAGRLIDKAGLKGLKIGGLRISEKHGNFFINDGTALFEDFRELTSLVSERVKAESGVELELEVEVVGDPKGTLDSENRSVSRRDIGGTGHFDQER